MRPIKLEVEGFTSFRQKQILDFAELDLFAITGPTGAGKSSLLDAIVYALFGKTPRLGKTGNELVSQGCANMFVRLEFQAGSEVYQVYRKRGTTAKGQLEKKSLDGKWMPETSSLRDLDKKIEQIVGLNFEGFTRAVILPQGKFDDFLRGNTDERRKVLKDLLNLKVFEQMMQNANAKSHNLNAEIKRVESQIAGDITEEKKGEIEKAIAGLADEEAAQEKLIQQLEKGQELAEELSQHRAKHENIQSEQEGAEQEVRELNGRLQELQAALSMEQAALSKIHSEIVALAYDPEEHLRVAQLIPQVQQFVDLKGQLEELKSEHASSKNKLDLDQARKDEADQAASKASEVFKSDEANLAAAKQRVDSLHAFYGMPQTIRSLVDELKNASKLEVQLYALQSEIESLEQKLSGKEKILDGLKQALTEAEKQKADAEQILESLKLKHRAIDLRHNLHAGEVCPVCEQIVKTLPPVAVVNDLKNAERSSREAQKKFETARDEMQQGPHQFVLIEHELTHKSEKANGLIEVITRVRGQAAKMLATESGDASPDQLEQLAVSVEQAQHEAERLGQEFKFSQSHEFQCRSDAERLKHLCESHRLQMDGFAQQMERLQKELAAIQQKLGEVPDLAKLEDRSTGFDQARKQKDILEQRRVATDAKLARTEMDIAGASQLLDAETNRIVKSAREIEACSQKISTTEKSLKKSVAPFTLNAGRELEELKTELKSSHKSLLDLGVSKKEQELALKSVIEKLNANKKLRAESQHLKSSAAVYDELGTLLSANRFQDYMLRSSYKLLAREGSHYFEELTGQRYSFHFDADADQFSVRDHANGDDLRSVSTLSGGESFLASLSLALALSQSIRDLSGEHGAVALESLFLDEGFSTLDPETLSKVADALPALQKKGRLIGIITHVEALAEQLPSRIEIEKTTTGSHIVQSHSAQSNMGEAASA